MRPISGRQRGPHEGVYGGPQHAAGRHYGGHIPDRRGPRGAPGGPQGQQDGTGRGHGTPARVRGYDGPRRGLASPDRQDLIADRMGAS